MNVQIEECDDVSVIAPILQILRDAIPQDVFQPRLRIALQNGFRVFIAQESESVLGCLGFHFTHDVYWGKTLYVDDLVVRPEARGAGIGAALLDVAKSQAKEQSCDHVRLCSGLSRIDAHRFYEDNGFNKTSIQFAYALPKGEV